MNTTAPMCYPAISTLHTGDFFMEFAIKYQYRTLPVERLADLQSDIEQLKAAGKISQNKVFKSYTDHFKYALPENFPEARTIIVLAVFVHPMRVNFHLDGAVHEVLQSHLYYEAGLTGAMLRQEVEQTILQNSGHRLERVDNMFMKRLAVRSGLARYGRNNICYVGEMGSFVALFAFLTDKAFDEDPWTEVRFLDQCEKCQVCLKNCPTGAIRTGEPVIDIERCLPLYNEIEGEFPAWIPPEAHNSLMGCLRCQLPCPANRQAIEHIGQLEDVTEDETRQFLSGSMDESTLQSVSQKLGLPYLIGSPETQAVFTRNLRVLIKQPGN